MAASTSSGAIPRALKGPPTVSSASGTPFTYSSGSQRSNGGRKGSQCMTSKPANCGQKGIQQRGAQLATQSTDAVAGAQALMSQAMHALAREHTEIPNNIPSLLWAKISNTATPEQERHMTQMLAQFSRGAKVPTLCRTACAQSTTIWRFHVSSSGQAFAQSVPHIYCSRRPISPFTGLTFFL